MPSEINVCMGMPSTYSFSMQAASSRQKDRNKLIEASMILVKS